MRQLQGKVTGTNKSPFPSCSASCNDHGPTLLYRFIMMSLMCVCSAMQMSSPCLVSNWKMCSTPATRILKNTAVLLLPNCMMSRSSAECRYSLGTGLREQGVGRGMA